jgi:hypothetical protein
MLTFQRERLAEVWPDAQRLFQLHYEELTFGKQRIELAPDTGRYEALERDGGLAIYTARDDGALVGYAAFFLIGGHMHYRLNSFAINDVFYVDPARRTDVWLGFRFLRFIDRELTEYGVDAIKWHVKVTRDFGPMLQRLGYQAEEVVWSKVI